MKTVIEMARESGLFVHDRKNQVRVGMDVLTGEDSTPALERFATLVREDERKEQALQRLSDIHQEIEQLRMLKDDDSLTIAYMAGAASERERFCDSHCVWTNHHKDCPVGKQQAPVARIDSPVRPDAYSRSLFRAEVTLTRKLEQFTDLYTTPPTSQQEPVACKRCNGTGIVPDGTIDCIDGYELETEIECVKDCPECTSTTPPTAPNLNCKSVQRRLATSWGYVRKEEYDMAKVAVVRQMRDAAVAFAAQYAQAAEDAYEQSGSRFDDGEANAARGIEEAIAALPIPGEEK